MISHVNIGITDFERAFAFYSAVLPELGLVLKFSEPDKPWAGWVSPEAPRPLFLIARPFDGQPHAGGNGQMVALQARTRAAVDRVYAEAMAQGARSEGAPGLRVHYHADYYGAYFRDLDGNKLCVCCHAAESTAS
ncbi:glyoxalase [Rhodoferax lacus]|uniref:Glyoxalase n=1 Tax=Rhodoferax lacus TaxID=2184758 RepID=A0A3E1RHD7_9BURK|nr:VOC family protein [Rhodoferax lacus]RFO98030.1 glyoxalase [Rhodoferax lacus]